MVPGQPGPNMRAATFQAQQAQQTKGQGASSIIMPIYTFGIVAFFVFTVVKIVMKKVNKEPKVKPLDSDPVFVERVLKQSQPDNKKKLGKMVKQRLKDGPRVSSLYHFLSSETQSKLKTLISGWKDHNASKSRIL